MAGEPHNPHRDLADHHSASFHDSEIGFTDIVGEMEAARDQIQHMQKVFGKNVEVMTGNHDANLQRKMKAVGLDPSLLRKQAEIWGIDWKFYPRYHKLQIDDYQVFHGDQGRGGKTPAIAKAEADWDIVGHRPSSHCRRCHLGMQQQLTLLGNECRMWHRSQARGHGVWCIVRSETNYLMWRCDRWRTLL